MISTIETVNWSETSAILRTELFVPLRSLPCKTSTGLKAERKKAG
jgi:hypothetical protein